MKYKLLIHPPEYALARTEAFYERQASMGWLLKSRNLSFSLFEKGEPQSLHYRVEFAAKRDGSIHSGITLPEDQVAWYEACGWHLVTSSGYVNLFCAPDTTDPGELYNEPEQQAATLVFARKRSAQAAIAAVFYLAIILLFHGQLFSPFFSGQIFFLMSPAFWLGICLLAFWRFLSAILRFLGFRALQRQLAAGQKYDGRARKRFRSPWRPVSGVMLLCAVVLLAFGSWNFFRCRSQALTPAEASPALLLNETDLPAPSGMPYFSGNMDKGQFITCWLMTQQADTAEGHVFFHQEFYLLPSSDWSATLLPRLAVWQRWGSHYDAFKALSVPGFDHAAVSPDGQTVVARRGRWLCRINCTIDGRPFSQEELTTLFSALSTHLSAFSSEGASPAV